MIRKHVAEREAGMEWALKADFPSESVTSPGTQPQGLWDLCEPDSQLLRNRTSSWCACQCSREGADGTVSLSDIGTTLFHLGPGRAEALLGDHSENEPSCCHMQVEKLYFLTGGENKLPLLALRAGQHWPQVGVGHGGEAQVLSPLMESSGQEGNILGQTQSLSLFWGREWAS